MARTTRAGPYLLLLDESARRHGWDHASPCAAGRDRWEEGEVILNKLLPETHSARAFYTPLQVTPTHRFSAFEVLPGVHITCHADT